jgi:hypothetical protein
MFQFLIGKVQQDVSEVLEALFTRKFQFLIGKVQLEDGDIADAFDELF